MRGRRIKRRDFLNGVALGAGLGRLAPAAARAAEGPLPPPALTGLRGSHDGSFEAAHRVKDGLFWKTAGAPEDTGERYDLVVVGAGISGLAAAHFWRKEAGPHARILLLDNHDDFGGHARRNEFRPQGRLLLAYGGTQSFESPGRYSAVAAGLLKELGIETARFHTAFDTGLYERRGLTTGIFFDRETFGADRLLAGLGRRPWPELLAEAPLSDTVRRDLVRLYSESADYLGGRAPDEKRALLRRTSYADFLTGFARVAPAALPFFQTRTHDLFGVGIEAVSAYTCFHLRDDYGGVDYPGARGLGLPELLAPGDQDEPYIFHFPDGNASLARLLVSRLLPHALPATGMDDVVTASARYDRLDAAGAPTRLRLESTVVRVRHEGAPAGADGPPRGDVEVAYLRAGRLQTVRAGQAVLACWNGMIPHLCPDLPAAQKEALAYGVKVPLVYSQVQIRNWTAFARLGVHQVAAPGSYHPWVALDFPVSLGDYRFPARPEEPAVVFMMRTPCKPGRPAREQHRLGRFELMATPFATFERKIREQLGRMLGPGGFDPDRDVEALTVNRWSHGYAYEYNSLFDPEWPPGQAPNERGRRPFGRVAIANADAAARAYTDAAIDEAWRAVRELRG